MARKRKKALSKTKNVESSILLSDATDSLINLIKTQRNDVLPLQLALWKDRIELSNKSFLIKMEMLLKNSDVVLDIAKFVFAGAISLLTVSKAFPLINTQLLIIIVIFSPILIYLTLQRRQKDVTDTIQALNKSEKMLEKLQEDNLKIISDLSKIESDISVTKIKEILTKFDKSL